jgi:hypothetical protein
MLCKATSSPQFLAIDVVPCDVQYGADLGWRNGGFGHTSQLRTHARVAYGRVGTTLRRAW